MALPSSGHLLMQGKCVRSQEWSVYERFYGITVLAAQDKKKEWVAERQAEETQLWAPKRCSEAKQNSAEGTTGFDGLYHEPAKAGSNTPGSPGRMGKTSLESEQVLTQTSDLEIHLPLAMTALTQKGAFSKDSFQLVPCECVQENVHHSKTATIQPQDTKPHHSILRPTLSTTTSSHAPKADVWLRRRAAMPSTASKTALIL